MVCAFYLAALLSLGEYRLLRGHILPVLMIDIVTRVIGAPTPEAKPEPIPEDTTRLGDALYAASHRALYRKGGPYFQDMTQSE